MSLYDTSAIIEGDSCVPSIVWTEFIQPLAQPGRKLISPAITNSAAPGGTTWLDDFLEACSGCQIDGVAAHWYGGRSPK